jgi:hypothetical protein
MPTIDLQPWYGDSWFAQRDKAEIVRMLADPPIGINDAIDDAKSNTVDLDRPIRAFMVTVAGAVKVTMADGTSGVIPGCTPGNRYSGMFLRVWDDGTTATGIVGFY